MRRLAFSLVLMIFMVSSVALVQASSMDISDPTCTSEICPNPVGLTFSFDSNTAGGGAFIATNTSGEVWTSLSIVETGVPAFIGDIQNILLSSNAFTNFEATDQADGSTLIRFFGIDTALCADDLPGVPDIDSTDLVEHCGIGINDIFTISLNDDHSPNPDGTGGWLDQNGSPIHFVALVPEPASLLLLGAGLAGILGLKKKQRRS